MELAKTPMSPAGALSAIPPVGTQEGRAVGKDWAQNGYSPSYHQADEPRQVTKNNEGPLLSTYLMPGIILST